MVAKLISFFRRKSKKAEEDGGRDIIFALQSIVSSEEIFDPEEKDLIENVLSFARREVWNIMTPRNKVEAIEKSATFEDVMDILKSKKYSKIPVYEGTNDNIIGYIEIKDILVNSLELTSKSISIDKIIKPMYFVPETKKLSEMLLDFEKKQIKIATVIDEYGSAIGIVTVSDVLGEILGEIIDESFKIENKIVPLSEDRFIVNGDISIDDFKEFFNVEVENGDFETLAGFVIEKFGDIPDEGYSIEMENLRIVLKKKTHSHIEQFLVERI